MLVTKFQYPLEELWIKKLDLIIERCTRKNPKDDAVLIIDAPEGVGKTTCSIANAFYVAEKTGRTFSEKNVFFDSENLLKFAQESKEQIIIWDEPASDALSKDWMSKSMGDISRLLMMCRKRRHFIMINMTRFYKFNEDMAIRRSIGMIHLYRRKQNDKEVRFVYIPKKNLENLFRDYKTKKIANFKKYSSKKCRGVMPDVLNEERKYSVLSEFNIDQYENNKDEAIMSIGKKKETVNQKDQKLYNEQGKLYHTLHTKYKLSYEQIANDTHKAVSTVRLAVRKYEMSKIDNDESAGFSTIRGEDEQNINEIHPERVVNNLYNNKLPSINGAVVPNNKHNKEVE